MKVLQSSIFRALCAGIVGGLLIAYPDRMTEWLVILIGILFLVPGLISLASWRHFRPMDENDVRPFFPLIGVGSILFGLVLVLFPLTFISYLMYVLGGLLILGGIYQWVSLLQWKKKEHISPGFYITPTLILLAGIFVVMNPVDVASVPFLIAGIAAIVYGISECVNALRIHTIKRHLKAAMNEVEGNNVSDTENDTPPTDNA